MNIKPIRNDEDYEAALQEIDRLWDAEEGTLDEDNLDMLCDLVEAYEHRAGYEIPPPEPIAAIEYYMESRGLSQEDLMTLIGPLNRVNEILSRKYPLTLPMIQRLASKTDIPASILITPYETTFTYQMEWESRMQEAA